MDYSGTKQYLNSNKQQMSGVKKCRRNGCRKEYSDDANTETSCQYHPGRPLFHDTKKGWTCCGKTVYDWDEFEKLPACATGMHSDVKPEGDEFFKSQTVSNAAKAIEKQSNGIVIKDINEYNKIEDEKKKKQQQEKGKEEKKLFKTKKGNLKCVNQGCGKEFVEAENNEDACQFHKGQPVFHDLKKYWTCCGKETYDWDQFMKLPKCSKGYHSPKYV